MAIIHINPLRCMTDIRSWIPQGGDACDVDVLQIIGSPGPESGSCFYYGQCFRIAIDGGFLGGTKIGQACGGSSSYVTVVHQSRISVDVWQALKDGAWSSSTVLSVYGDAVNTIPYPGNATIEAKPYTAAVPASQTIIAANWPAGVGNVCVSTLRRTVTVYDDGTFTLA